ncbi:MAG: hypothetical protein H0T42_22880 [Deltaproteobacteria bacterium]|nr:hypothetical protein [Deltaproteobacteria bacterium]
MIRATLVLLIACGGARPAPQPPKIDTRALAAELDAQLGEVASIIHTRRDDCPGMASELRALFVRMEASLARAREAQKDPELAKQLTTDMRAYDQASAQRVAQIEADFTVDATCARHPAVRETLEAMPIL